MIVSIAKRIVSSIWIGRVKYSCRNKFKLYGNYKKLYQWSKYEHINEHKQLFRKLTKNVNVEWYKYFTLIRQEEDINYLPEDIWHANIEPVLNNRSYAKGFNNKSLYHKSEFKELYPEAYLHVIEGVWYNGEYKSIDKANFLTYLPKDRSLVIKKSIDSGGGKGVGFFNSYKDINNYQYLEKNYGRDFVIQKAVKQHPWFEKFNPDSINSVRVITYRSVVDEQINVLQTVFRCGNPGSKVDNQSSGGIAVGINTSGKLNSWGTNKLSKKFNSINGIELNKEERVPFYDEMLVMCLKIAETRFFERVLVFDTWRDTEGKPRLLEINNVNLGIEDIQKNCGAMFGKFTEEVVDFCSKNKSNYNIDFEL